MGIVYINRDIPVEEIRHVTVSSIAIIANIHNYEYRQLITRNFPSVRSEKRRVTRNSL